VLGSLPNAEESAIAFTTRLDSSLARDVIAMAHSQLVGLPSGNGVMVEAPQVSKVRTMTVKLDDGSTFSLEKWITDQIGIIDEMLSIAKGEPACLSYEETLLNDLYHVDVGTSGDGYIPIHGVRASVFQNVHAYIAASSIYLRANVSRFLNTAKSTKKIQKPIP
jgi:hypothetical protein